MNYKLNRLIPPLVLILGFLLGIFLGVKIGRIGHIPLPCYSEKNQAYSVWCILKIGEIIDEYDEK